MEQVGAFGGRVALREPGTHSIRHGIDLQYFCNLLQSSNTFAHIGRIIDLYISALTLLGWFVCSTLSSPASAQVAEENTNRDAPGASSPASHSSTSGQEGTGSASEQSTPEDLLASKLVVEIRR
jgi:hypothetical protein